MSFPLIKFLKSFWKAIVWTIIIIFLSSMSSDSFNKINILNIYHIDKIAHMGMYFIQSILFLAAFFDFYYRPINYIRYRINSLIIAIITGSLIEIMQNWFIINRSGDWLDLIANIAGSFLAILLYKYLINIFSNIFFKNK